MSDLIYRQTDYPIFQNRMYDSAEEARNCPKGEIALAEDPATGIVCNRAFRPELMIYDKHYQNEQGLSPAFQRHMDEVAGIVATTLGKDRLVEVGCGKGYFLERLAQGGFDIAGFDPAYEGDNLRIRREVFSSGIINRAQGLVLRHVLEHIQHPLVFLHQIAAANENTGHIYIEVPCFDWICQHRAWFDIFYEHVNYFRLSDFQRWFGNVIAAGHLFGGQYLYVVASLDSLRESPPPASGNSVSTARLPFCRRAGETQRCQRKASGVGRRIKGRHILSVDGACRMSGRSDRRYQPSQTRKVCSRYGVANSIAGNGICLVASRHTYLHHEFKLSGRNPSHDK